MEGCLTSLKCKLSNIKLGHSWGGWPLDSEHCSALQNLGLWGLHSLMSTWKHIGQCMSSFSDDGKDKCEVFPELN